MFPLSKTNTKKHRAKKRKLEIELAIESILTVLKRENKIPEKGNTKIFEFGCGDGFQIEQLSKIGDLTVSDLYQSDEIKKMKDVKFVQGSINNTQFKNEEFDIIYSNHVIEHIENQAEAFMELRRIGKPSCIYAFSVPTNFWLLLSLPTIYLGNIKNLIRNLFFKKEYKSGFKSIWKEFKKFLFPCGHGIYRNYLECYRNFKIKSWEALLTKNGYSILEIKPLLLYGPSEWPIIPTMKNRANLCSSVLFLMRKGG